MIFNTMSLSKKELKKVFDETKECGDCLKAYDVKIEPSGIIKVICPYDNQERFVNSKCRYS
jgi:hypothetical protein